MKPTVTTTEAVMSENASSNVSQILASFDTFVKIIEDPSWPRLAKVEDIKTSFKLGSFIEKTMIHFESQNGTKQFLDILCKWWKEKNRTKVYPADFYSTACDEVLKIFFRCENISETSLDVAVRIYTSIFPKDRMENVLCKLILTAGSLEAISDFVKITSDDKSVNNLEYHLKLKNWSDLLETGNESCVREEIKEMLALYKVESYLHLLIGVLTLSGVSEQEKLVQDTVVNGILEKMLERSILSKPFWITLFNRVDVHCVSVVCLNFKDFLIYFFNFIVYTGSMMKKEGDMWQSDPEVCLCPEIGFQDILVHIQDVCAMNSQTKTYVVDRLNQAKEFTNSDIWKKIIEEIS